MATVNAGLRNACVFAGAVALTCWQGSLCFSQGPTASNAGLLRSTHKAEGGQGGASRATSSHGASSTQALVGFGVATAALALGAARRRGSDSKSRSQRLGVVGRLCNMEEEVSGNDMVAFISSACPYCRQAVQALKDAGFTPKVIEAGKGSAIRKELESKTGSSSVPKVWVKGNFVGGCNDGGLGGVLPLLKNGKIQELMTA
eukprot:CAMPEP_0115090390 /NCGR_PEP_ID=MMETSP0227-20121206/25387_1 /TAXON_ID=89957 /ORGANISM="Polarella glacialis, Strain CCMP 1383" /LENGTH=201 /DNA_ID=CAMNT_0002481499 /DNA_START=75 /DNA_END=680 /DNA_ORIENTATION=-